MANENKDDGVGTFILVIVIILIIGGNFKGCIEENVEKQQTTQQEVTQPIRNYINGQTAPQSSNTYSTQQKTNRTTYSESYSTGNDYSGNTYNTILNSISIENNDQTPSDNRDLILYHYTNEVSSASNENKSSSYYNYEETNDCVDGEVVYEGDDDYYIIETRRGYTICERYSGILNEGMKVRGELNRYKFRYIINKHNDNEIRIYIEDYALSENDAIGWMRKNKHIK